LQIVKHRRAQPTNLQGFFTPNSTAYEITDCHTSTFSSLPNYRVSYTQKITACSFTEYYTQNKTDYEIIECYTQNITAYETTGCHTQKNKAYEITQCHTQKNIAYKYIFANHILVLKNLLCFE